MWLSIKPSRAEDPSRLRLDDGALVTFREARGVVLECLSGRLWVTITGQPCDFLLGAGECLRVDSGGLGLVEGMPVGELRVVAAAEVRPVLPGVALSAAR